MTSFSKSTPKYNNPTVHGRSSAARTARSLPLLTGFYAGVQQTVRFGHKPTTVTSVQHRPTTVNPNELQLRNSPNCTECPKLYQRCTTHGVSNGVRRAHVLGTVWPTLVKTGQSTTPSSVPRSDPRCPDCPCSRYRLAMFCRFSQKVYDVGCPTECPTVSVPVGHGVINGGFGQRWPKNCTEWCRFDGVRHRCHTVYHGVYGVGVRGVLSVPAPWCTVCLSLINTCWFRRWVSGCPCLAVTGSPWPYQARVSPVTMPAKEPSATSSDGIPRTAPGNPCSSVLLGTSASVCRTSGTTYLRY